MKNVSKVDLIDMYNHILKDFGNEREIVSKNYSCIFGNYNDALFQGCALLDKTKNTILIERKDNELHFHNFLKHQLFSHLQEIKYYSPVNISDTRRLISVSQDCISSIHILVRDNIYINTYFRSSDFDYALPVDVEFLCTIPGEMINHIKRFKGIKGYEEVTDALVNTLEMKPIQLNLMFGSLHRTNND